MVNTVKLERGKSKNGCQIPDQNKQVGVTLRLPAGSWSWRSGARRARSRSLRLHFFLWRERWLAGENQRLVFFSARRSPSPTANAQTLTGESGEACRLAALAGERISHVFLAGSAYTIGRAQILMDQNFIALIPRCNFSANFQTMTEHKFLLHGSKLLKL
jgi:hypothetical protein